MDEEIRVPPGTIVVGVDATEAADQALEWAIEEARAEQVPLTLVHAAGPAITAWLELEMDLRDVIDAVRTTGGELLSRACAQVARLAPEVEVIEVLRLAGPHEALMELASEAAMIVIGSRSDGAHQGPLLESAVGFIADHAPCPVVVPRRHGDQEDLGIVVLCDGTADSIGPLAYACYQAERRGLPVTVLLCLPDPPADGLATDIALMDATARMEADLGPSLLGFERMLLIDTVNALRHRWPEVTARVVLEDGAIDDCLERVASGTQMLVLGAHHTRRVSEHVIGSAAPDQVRCVTVILPQEDRAEVDVHAAFSTIGIGATGIEAIGMAESPEPADETRIVEPGPGTREIRVPAHVPLVRRLLHHTRDEHTGHPERRGGP